MKKDKLQEGSGYYFSFFYLYFGQLLSVSCVNPAELAPFIVVHVINVRNILQDVYSEDSIG